MLRDSKKFTGSLLAAAYASSVIPTGSVVGVTGTIARPLELGGLV